METGPDDPTEGEKAATRYETLLALYPRDRAREMIKAYLDTLPVDDAVFLPDTSPEQLEAEMAELDEAFEDADPQVQAELDSMKQLFRDVRGKRPSELPQPTPEEEAEELEREVETAIAQMTSAWINMLYVVRSHAGGGEVLLTEELLETDPPFTFDAPDEGVHWLEACCNSIALSPEQARELQALWASKLRPLIDAAPEGYVLWGDEFVIKKGAGGYVLLAHAAP